MLKHSILLLCISHVANNTWPWRISYCICTHWTLPSRSFTLSGPLKFHATQNKSKMFDVNSATFKHTHFTNFRLAWSVWSHYIGARQPLPNHLDYGYGFYVSWDFLMRLTTRLNEYCMHTHFVSRMYLFTFSSFFNYIESAKPSQLDFNDLVMNFEHIISGSKQIYTNSQRNINVGASWCIAAYICLIQSASMARN